MKDREKIDVFLENSVLSDGIAEKLVYERLYLDIPSEIYAWALRPA